MTAGLTTTSVFNSAAGASLSGTVRFDDGGPASILRLHLYRKDGSGRWKPYLNHSGDPVMAPLGLGTHTDSRGHFTELGLPEGIYCIEIMFPEVVSASDTITGNPSVTYRVSNNNALRIYNGDKFRLRDAAPIELHEGEARSGIDIVIPTSGLHSLHGFVVAKTTAIPLRRDTFACSIPTTSLYCETVRFSPTAPSSSTTFSKVLTCSRSKKRSIRRMTRQ